MPEELRRLQDKDESLDRPRLIADGALSTAAGEQFFRQEGLVYRRYTPAGSNEDAHSVDQLVLPTQLRLAVLRLAHDIPMVGHLGRRRQWIASANGSTGLRYTVMSKTIVGPVLSVRSPR